MRLSKFLSLSVAMSRNQAKFFIRRGRLSVDGTVTTDPEFELGESSAVVFDGKPISIAGYQYIVMHKPPAYACVAKGSAQRSVLELLKGLPDDRYFYFANVLGADATGLVLLSDDARWKQRIKLRLSKKPRIYLARLADDISEEQLEQLRDALLAPVGGDALQVLDIQRHDEKVLRVKVGQAGVQSIIECFASAGVVLDRLHLQQLGKLSLGDLPEGDYLELAEDDIKI